MLATSANLVGGTVKDKTSDHGRVLGIFDSRAFPLSRNHRSNFSSPSSHMAKRLIVVKASKRPLAPSTLSSKFRRLV